VAFKFPAGALTVSDMKTLGENEVPSTLPVILSNPTLLTNVKPASYFGF